MNHSELFKRTCQILHPDWAQEQAVAVIGAGSGGARVAEEMARLGIGRILLVDRPGERLEEHNIIRHPLGYRDLGRLKVQAMRDRLLDINPSAAVEAIELDVARDDRAVAELAARCTLIQLCTDNEPSKHAVNLAAVRAAMPMIFAGVFDGGCGGEVGRYTPGGACYACMAAQLGRSTAIPGQEQAPIDYTNPNALNQRSTAALNIDIAQIALLQARVGLLTLLRATGQRVDEDFDGNYILFGNRKVERLFDRMLASEIWTIPPLPHCLICGQPAHSDVETDRLARELLAGASVQP